MGSGKDSEMQNDSELQSRVDKIIADIQAKRAEYRNCEEYRDAEISEKLQLKIEYEREMAYDRLLGKDSEPVGCRG
jgi:hypothetical protein